MRKASRRKRQSSSNRAPRTTPSRRKKNRNTSISPWMKHPPRPDRRPQRQGPLRGRRHRGLQDRRVTHRPFSYHPCHVGEVLVNRYVLIQKLGWGHFSTVWLAKDFKYGNYAAVKIMKSSPHYLEASYDEVSLMVSKTGRNPTKSGQQRLSSSVDRIPQKI